MDYSNPSCRTTFTEDQTAVMYTILEEVRANLHSVTNINRTMSNGCALSAKFNVTSQVCIESNDSVHIEAYDYEDSITYHWKVFEGSTLVIQKRDTFPYWTILPTDGIYNLQLTISNGTDSITILKDSVFRVDSCGTILKHPKANWMFGNHASIKFTENGVFRNTKLYYEGPNNLNSVDNTISLSDSNGNLLFYGGVIEARSNNHLWIFDSTYIKNLVFLEGARTRSPVIALHHPELANRFIFIHPGTYNFNNSLLYSYYDMSISDFKEDIDFKDIINKPILGSNGQEFQNNNGERINAIHAIKKCNNKDYWLLVHNISGNELYDSVSVFSVTKDTITFEQNYPTYQKFGTHYLYSSTAEITSSPDGKFLNMGRGIYKFNRSTGDISSFHFDTTILDHYIFSGKFSPNGKVVIST